jgi:hypothetical protein
MGRTTGSPYAGVTRFANSGGRVTWPTVPTTSDPCALRQRRYLVEGLFTAQVLQFGTAESGAHPEHGNYAAQGRMLEVYGCRPLHADLVLLVVPPAGKRWWGGAPRAGPSAQIVAKTDAAL